LVQADVEPLFFAEQIAPFDFPSRAAYRRAIDTLYLNRNFTQKRFTINETFLVVNCDL